MGGDGRILSVHFTCSAEEGEIVRGERERNFDKPLHEAVMDGQGEDLFCPTENEMTSLCMRR